MKGMSRLGSKNGIQRDSLHPIWLWLTYLFIPAILNPIAFLLITPIAEALWFGQVDPLYLMIEMNQDLLVHGMNPVDLTRAIPFIVTLPLISLYILRMSHVVYKKEHPKRAWYVFNSPFLTSIFITLGWFISFLVNVYAIDYLGKSYSTQEFLISLGFTLFIAFFLNVLGFYLIDLVNRSFLVPRLAVRDLEIKRTTGFFNLSLRSRIFILLMGTAGFGIYFYTYTIYIQSIKLEELGVRVSMVNHSMVALILLAAMVIFGLLFHKGLVFPLRSMELAARKIEEENYHHKIPIRTGDELGLLSRAMNTMSQGLAEKERVQGLFGRYLSPEVVKVLLKEQKSVESGSMRNLTVFFTDIQGYTSLSETLTPEEVVQILNQYFSQVVGIISKHGGTVNKFIGDAVMAIFGAPIPDPQHPLKALEAALEIQKTLASARFLGHQLITRIGINTGEALVGSIGSQDRREYTVIGDTVNLAQRLEAANKQTQTNILLGPQTANAVSNHYQLRDLGEIQVKGLKRKISVFSPDI